MRAGLDAEGPGWAAGGCWGLRGQPLGGQSVGLRDGRALLSGGFRSFWGLHAHICLAETFCVGGNLVLSIEKV